MGVSEGNLMNDAEEWRTRLAHDAATISDILSSMRRIAVIGIKPASAMGPAHSVPKYLQQKGFDIVPVPVYYPELTEILGVPVHRSLATVQPPADVVQIFRRPADVPQHLDDILAAKPKVVWMQLGIRNDAVAETLARAGIHVIQNRCMQVELERRSNEESER